MMGRNEIDLLLYFCCIDRNAVPRDVDVWKTAFDSNERISCEDDDKLNVQPLYEQNA